MVMDRISISEWSIRILVVIVGIGGFVGSICTLPFTIPAFISQYGFARASVLGMGITVVGVSLTVGILYLMTKLVNNSK